MLRPLLRPPCALVLLRALTGAALVAPVSAAARPAGARAASAAVAPPPSVVVAVPLLNRRAAPRLSAPLLRRLPQGTVLRLRFYHVSGAAVTAPDDTIGYVDRAAVRPLAPAPAPAVPAPVAPACPPACPPAPLVSLTMAAAVATLRATPDRATPDRATPDRAAPDRATPILALLPHRTALTVLGVDRRGTWARVATRAGRVGWVALYLTRPA